MKTKRAQAAMEFLMTYGWALLVMLVVIGVFLYLGVLNPNAQLPDQCLLFSGMHCVSSYATANPSATDPVEIEVLNAIGYTMNGLTLSLDVDDVTLTPGASDCSVGASLLVGSSRTCGFSLPSGKSVGDTFKGTATITWSDQQSQVRQRMGQVVLTVEA